MGNGMEKSYVAKNRESPEHYGVSFTKVVDDLAVADCNQLKAHPREFSIRGSLDKRNLERLTHIGVEVGLTIVDGRWVLHTGTESRALPDRKTLVQAGHTRRDANALIKNLSSRYSADTFGDVHSHPVSDSSRGEMDLSRLSSPSLEDLIAFSKSAMTQDDRQPKRFYILHPMGISVLWFMTQPTLSLENLFRIIGIHSNLGSPRSTMKETGAKMEQYAWDNPQIDSEIRAMNAPLGLKPVGGVSKRN